MITQYVASNISENFRGVEQGACSGRADCVSVSYRALWRRATDAQVGSKLMIHDDVSELYEHEPQDGSYCRGYQPLADRMLHYPPNSVGVQSYQCTPHRRGRKYSGATRSF